MVIFGLNGSNSGRPPEQEEWACCCRGGCCCCEEGQGSESVSANIGRIRSEQKYWKEHRRNEKEVGKVEGGREGGERREGVGEGGGEEKRKLERGGGMFL